MIALAAAVSLLLFCPAAVCAQAPAEEETLQEFAGELPQSVQKYLAPEEVTEESAAGLLIRVLRRITADILSYLSAPLALFGSIAAVSCAHALFTPLLAGQGAAGKAAGLTADCVCWLAAVRASLACIGDAQQALLEASELMGAALPVMTGLLVATGRVGSAAFLNMATAFISRIITGAAVGAAAKAVGFAAGLSAASALLGGALDRFSQGVCRLCSRLLVAAGGIYFAVVRVQNAVLSSADEAALKAGKLAIGAAVPVLGSTISDSAGVIAASVSVIRSALGSAAIAALAALLLPQLLQALLICLALGAGEALSELLGDERLGGTLRTLRGAANLIAAVCALSLVSLVVTVACILLANGG